MNGIYYLIAIWLSDCRLQENMFVIVTLQNKAKIERASTLLTMINYYDSLLQSKQKTEAKKKRKERKKKKIDLLWGRNCPHCPPPPPPWLRAWSYDICDDKIFFLLVVCLTMYVNLLQYVCACASVMLNYHKTNHNLPLQFVSNFLTFYFC